MPLLKKWQEIVRQTHIDEGVVLREAIKLHIRIMRMIGNDEHMKKPGEFLAHMAALGTTIGKAEALSKKTNDILENNSKVATSIVREKERANAYRIKERRR